MNEPEKCAESVWNGWSSHPCQRPVKRNGKCGIHAAAQERVERNDAARVVKRREQAERNDARDARQAELLEAEVVAAIARDVLMDYGDDCCDRPAVCACSMARLYRALAPTTHEAAPVVETRT